MGAPNQAQVWLTTVADWLSAARRSDRVDVNELRALMKSYQEDTADPDFENYEPRDEIDPDDMETIICSFVNDTGGELSWDQVGRNPLAHSEVLEFLFELSQSMPWDLDVLVANNPHCDESLLARRGRAGRPGRAPERLDQDGPGDRA